MSSAPVAGMGNAAAPTGLGASGMLTGNATGLDGLFGALLSATVPVGPGAAVGAMVPAENMISVLLGGQVGGAATIEVGAELGAAVDGLAETAGLVALPVQSEVRSEVQLGNGPVLTVSGDAATVKTFVTQLKEIYQKLVVEGGLTVGDLGDSKTLATALTKLGMAQDEAVGVAARIETMLKLLEQGGEGQAALDDKTAGSLVAMMLAVMGQQGVSPLPVAEGGGVEAAPVFGLQISSSVAQALPAGGRAWTMKLGADLGGDVTRDLLGLEERGARNEEREVVGAAPRKVEVAVTDDGVAAIGVGLPEVKNVNIPSKPTAVDARPSEAAQAAAVVTTSGAAVQVAAEERLQAPRGDTYYKLQADKHGVETLEAVKPLVDVRDVAAVATPATAAAVTAAAPVTTEATNGAAFAERVAQIQSMVEKAEVGKQVLVQMQPLLASGEGGTVRINLKPRELGSIAVELNVVNGRVHGSIAATEPAVVEQLARELHSLRHGLADAGLKLGEQGINLMLSNSNQQNPGQGHHAQDQAAARAATARRGGMGDGVNGAGTGAVLADSLAAWVSPDRLLDVNA